MCYAGLSLGKGGSACNQQANAVPKYFDEAESAMAPRKTPEMLRSAALVRARRPAFVRSSLARAMQMGYAPEEWVGKPVIAILNTWSDAQPCHMHFKSRVEDVKRGVLMAGGLPLELPARCRCRNRC